LDFKDYNKPYKNTIKIIHSEEIIYDEEEENLIFSEKAILR